MIEQALGALPLQHPIRHSISMQLVFIPNLPHAPLERNPTTLLNNMRRLMGSGMQIRRSLKGDIIASGISLRTHGRVGLCGGRTRMCFDAGDVMLAKRMLDLVAKGHRVTGPLDPGGCGLVVASASPRRGSEHGAAVGLADRLLGRRIVDLPEHRPPPPPGVAHGEGDASPCRSADQTFYERSQTSL